MPPGDEESNYRLAAETLIAGAGIPAERVHRMRGELGPDEGARAYAEELAALPQAGGTPVLDVVHLGMGPDGHTASLFPRHPALEIADAPTAAIHDSPKPPPERITLTLPVLRAARACVLHAVGEAKREALGRALAEPAASTPASLLRRDRSRS